MILIDTNILVYAHVSSFPQHKPAKSWLDEQLNGSIRVGLPWASLLSFVRLVSNPRLFKQAEPVAEAWQQVEQWLDCPSVWVPLPTGRHPEILRRIFTAAPIKPEMVPDAHLAALAIEHGLKVCSTDRDFMRFSGIEWLNPLTAT